MKPKPKSSRRWGLQPIGGLITSSSEGTLATVSSLLKAKRLLSPLLPPSVQSHVQFLQIDRGTLTILIDHPAWRTQLQPLEGMFRQVLGLDSLRFRYRVARLQNQHQAKQQKNGPGLASIHNRNPERDHEGIAEKISRWRQSLLRVQRGEKE